MQYKDELPKGVPVGFSALKNCQDEKLFTKPLYSVDEARQIGQPFFALKESFDISDYWKGHENTAWTMIIVCGIILLIKLFGV